MVNLCSYERFLQIFETATIVLRDRCRFKLRLFCFVSRVFLLFRKRHFLFQSYLLTRYLHPRDFLRKKVIVSLDQMYLGRSHIFRTDGMNWTEKVFLNHYFQSKKL